MDPFAAAHDPFCDADAWDTGPFAIFQLAGPVLAVGSSIEEVTQRAERALDADITELHRWGEARLVSGDLYLSPIDAGVADMIRNGKRMIVPGDATPDEPKLETPPRPPTPAIDGPEMERRFRLSIERHFNGAEALGMLRADILGCLTAVTGETICLVSRGDAGEIGMHVGMVKSAANRACIRVKQAVERELADVKHVAAGGV